MSCWDWCKTGSDSTQVAVLVMIHTLATESYHDSISQDWYPTSIVTVHSMLLEMLVRKGTSAGQKQIMKEKFRFGFVHLFWLMKRAKVY